MLKKRNLFFLCLLILGVFLLTGCFLVANPPYTVTYDGNGNTGGSVPIDDGLYQENQLVTVLSEGDLVNTGFVFTDWNTQADGSGTVQAAASTFTMGAADVILYAQWTSSARYVSKTGDNLNDGRSSDSSWLTISHALSETPDGGTIHVANGTYEEDIIFPTDKVIVLKSINGRNVTTIKGTGDDSVVKFSGCPDGTILDGFTVTGGKTQSGGGIYIYNGCSPTIQNNTISGNTAAYGGGINIYGYSATIQNNIISGNTAHYDGGGINMFFSSSTIQNNIISGNTATGHNNYGGGFFIEGGSPTIKSNTISENTATGRNNYGGGFYIKNCQPTIESNTISKNNAYYGGGIYVERCSPTIQDNIISENTTTYGGGIYIKSSSFTIESNTISENIAQFGGGFYIDGGSPTILNNIISENTITGTNFSYGGGIYILNSSATIKSNTISENGTSFSFGGGINIVNSSPTIKSNTISRNNATNESGGGIWFDESSLPTIGGETIDDTTDFNTICGNISGGTCTTDNQVEPNDCPNNYICIECAGCGGT